MSDINHPQNNPKKPSTLAEEVGDLLKKSSENEDENVNPADGRYRDIGLEQKIAAQKSAQKAMQQAEDELEAVEEQEQDFIDATRGQKKHKEKTRKQSRTEAKKSKEAKKENTRQITKSLQQKKELKQQILQGLKASRENLLKVGKKAVEKIAAYKMHAERAPGDQAGVFDKNKISPEKNSPQKDKGLQHDRDFGSESRVEHFKTKINGLEVEGTVMTRVDDNKKTGKLEQVEKAEVKIDKVSKDGSEVSKGNLGNLSSDAIMRNLPKDDMSKGIK